MQADFSVELGGDSPALEIPWSSNDPNVRYVDLKSHPESIQQIPEAVAYPELGAFLSRINAPGFPLATAKCDAWASSEVAPEEEIFGDRKFVSYIDLIFVDEKDRCSFEKSEAFAKQLCRLLGHAPEIAATVELVIRHCHWHEGSRVPNDGGACGDSSASENSFAFENSPALRNSSVLKNSSEQSGTGPSMTQREQGMRLTNDERIGPDAETHLLSPELCADIVGQADIVEQSDVVEQARISFHDLSNDIALHNKHADIVPPAQPRELGFHHHHADVVPCDQRAGATTHQESTRGLCITAYVTGFGNRDHDPSRQCAIGLNLLLHAIVQLNSNAMVQLNSNSQPKS